jgi:hypothetical protein
MVEVSIGAEGASSNALGGCGFVQAAESDDTHAKLFRAFSTHLARRAATARSGENLPPPHHGQAPRLARAKGCATHIEVPKRAVKKVLRFDGRADKVRHVHGKF